MNLFLDTSAIVKLYNPEAETEELTNFILQDDIEEILISEIALIEFHSAFWKKFRENQITEDDLNIVIKLFSNETFYKIIPLSESIIKTAIDLMERHGRNGLRTLDSIQMSSIFIANVNYDDLTVITFDSILTKIIALEGIQIYSKS
ncbi:MAG: type II toxin-antitoxin system VapC family toxin [Leptospiraceae bacterium]|nr:type II toxin-antitoxin system VapC family toxin [Leptospiraceae bacterium]MCP5496457.1 type II toxin-antitoxin system VapC family toxin [Leptospiraceae bacterium]